MGDGNRGGEFPRRGHVGSEIGSVRFVVRVEVLGNNVETSLASEAGGVGCSCEGNTVRVLGKKSTCKLKTGEFHIHKHYHTLVIQGLPGRPIPIPTLSHNLSSLNTLKDSKIHRKRVQDFTGGCVV